MSQKRPHESDSIRQSKRLRTLTLRRDNPDTREAERAEKSEGESGSEEEEDELGLRRVFNVIDTRIRSNRWKVSDVLLDVLEMTLMVEYHFFRKRTFKSPLSRHILADIVEGKVTWNTLDNEEREMISRKLQQLSTAVFTAPYKVDRFPTLTLHRMSGLGGEAGFDYHNIKPLFKKEILLHVFEKMMDRLTKNLFPAEHGNDIYSLPAIWQYFRKVPVDIPEVVSKSNVNEDNFSRLFKNFIMDPCDALFKSRGFNIDFNTKIQVRIGSYIRLDIAAKKGDKVVFFVEMKNYGVRERFEACLASNPSGAFKTSRKQVAVSLLKTKTRYCLVSDFFNTVILRLRRPRRKSRRISSASATTESLLKADYEVEVEFDYKLININDHHLTLQAAFAALSYHQSQRSEEEKKEDEEICNEVEQYMKNTPENLSSDFEESAKQDVSLGSKPVDKMDLTKASNMISESCDSFESDAEILQDNVQNGQQHNSLIYKMSSETFFNYFPSVQVDIAANEEVALKVYDTASMNDFHFLHENELFPLTMDEYRVRCYREFVNEIECYNRIEQHNISSSSDRQIRTPKLYDYGALQLIERGKRVVFSGWYMLMSYVENEKNTVSKETIEDGCKQAQLLNEIGIAHNSISVSNVLVNQGHVYMIDFALAKKYGEKIDSSDESLMNSALKSLNSLDISSSQDYSDLLLIRDLVILPSTPSSALTGDKSHNK